jgi:hypothetical protein
MVLSEVDYRKQVERLANSGSLTRAPTRVVCWRCPSYRMASAEYCNHSSHTLLRNHALRSQSVPSAARGLAQEARRPLCFRVARICWKNATIRMTLGFRTAPALSPWSQMDTAKTGIFSKHSNRFGRVLGGV